MTSLAEENYLKAIYKLQEKFQTKSANFLTVIILTITIVMLVFATICKI